MKNSKGVKKLTINIIFGTVFLAAVAMFALAGNNFTSPAHPPKNNVSVLGERQIIEIMAKGGYVPKNSVAKADMPTVIKFNTQGTFDCSSSVRIPALGLSKNLPPDGATELEVPPQKAGTTLNGLCVMGMYKFSIDFK